MLQPYIESALHSGREDIILDVRTIWDILDVRTIWDILDVRTIWDILDVRTIWDIILDVGLSGISWM